MIVRRLCRCLSPMRPSVHLANVELSAGKSTHRLPRLVRSFSESGARAGTKIYFSNLRVTQTARSRNDVTFKQINVAVGINSFYSATGRLATLPSARSTISHIVENKLECSASLVESGISCLNNVAFLLPGLAWAGLEIQDKKRIEDKGPHRQRLRINSIYSQETKLPSLQIPTSTRLSCVSTWSRPAVVGGISYNVYLHMYTEYDSWPRLQGKNFTTQGRIRPLSPPFSKPAGILEHEVLFDLHNEVLERFSSEECDDIQDLTQRSVLLTFLLNDNRPQNAPLTAVRFSCELRLPLKEVDLQPDLASAVKKPVLAAAAEMTCSEYDQIKRFAPKKPQSSINHSVYVALGSNVGDRLAMIERACRSLQARGIRILRTSALYETAPMYLEDQPPFLNGACHVETSLSSSKLLEELKSIELDLGRRKSIENGPRPIDLDILLYDNEKLELDHLTIPHPRLSEREFVLRPLCDLIPDLMPPSASLVPTFRDRLEALPKPSAPLSPLTPLSSSVQPIRSVTPNRQTRLMAILNLTPDSFSDGGIYSTDPSSLDPYLENLQSLGVTILDIGGHSTRPHAEEVPGKEEIARVLPTIRHIRSQSKYDNLVLSIDTYRASVAEAAIDAGADIVNDVSAGTLDPEMLPLVARLGCTVVLMHMRGTPSTMAEKIYYPNGVIEDVGQELRARVAAAEAAGIRRWRMILDPGIGFAKSQTQNLELLRRFGELRAYEGLRGIPWVVGASRKGFIGKITGVPKADERAMGTAATVCAAVQGGADIVRVHDVKEMAEVTKMADAIWRV